MRIFGSLGFMKLQEKKRSGYQKKVDPRSKKVVLSGYFKDFTYRLYDPVDGMIYICIDISKGELQRIIKKVGNTECHG